jgi:hypothetical protein
MMKVQFYRPDEACSEAVIRFNESALKIIQSKKFNVEDCPKGILITFPTVDNYNSFKVTSKKREAKIECAHDVDSGWFPMTKTEQGHFLIDLYEPEEED